MLWKIAIAVVVVLALFVFAARKVGSTVRVERILNSPLETVWALWNDPESIKKWWGPKGYSAPVVTSDFRVGGKFLLAMKSEKGETFWNTGTYQEIVPQRKIVSRLSFADEHGNALPGASVPVPGDWPDAVTVSVEFAPEAGKTRVAVTETGIPLIMKLLAGMGWEQQFDKIETLL